MYALACVAEKIFVPSTGIVGSIGVIDGLIDATTQDAMVGLLAPIEDVIPRILAGWNAGGLLYLVLIAIKMAHAEVEGIKREAGIERESRIAVLFIVIFGALLAGGLVVLIYALLSGLPMSDLLPFALCTAFPYSLDGRYSIDYYGSSVTLWLAPLRPSRIPVRRVIQFPLGSPFVTLPVFITPCPERVSFTDRRHFCLSLRYGSQSLSHRMTLGFTGDWSSGSLALTIGNGSCRSS